jgi:hypothetical protein
MSGNYKTVGQIEIEAEKYRAKQQESSIPPTTRLHMLEEDESCYFNPCNLLRYLCWDCKKMSSKPRIIRPFDTDLM